MARIPRIQYPAYPKAGYLNTFAGVYTMSLYSLKIAMFYEQVLNCQVWKGWKCWENKKYIQSAVDYCNYFGLKNLYEMVLFCYLFCNSINLPLSIFICL